MRQVATGAVSAARAASMFALKGNTDTADATATILLITMIAIVTQALLIALFAH
jgi:malonate transporter